MHRTDAQQLMVGAPVSLDKEELIKNKEELMCMKQNVVLRVSCFMVRIEAVLLFVFNPSCPAAYDLNDLFVSQTCF